MIFKRPFLNQHKPKKKKRKSTTFVLNFNKMYGKTVTNVKTVTILIFEVSGVESTSYKINYGQCIPKLY